MEWGEGEGEGEEWLCSPLEGRVGLVVAGQACALPWRSGCDLDEIAAKIGGGGKAHCPNTMQEVRQTTTFHGTKAQGCVYVSDSRWSPGHRQEVLFPVSSAQRPQA